jgi:agmatinase
MPARTILINPRVTPRFAGISTFCRFPRLEDVPPASRPIDWCLFGVPFDGGVTYRPGARFGPRAIREASQYVKPYHLEHAVNIAEALSLCDAGDAPVMPYSIKETLDSVAAWAVETARKAGAAGAPARTLAIGGDHSIAYANLRAAWELAGRPPGGLPLVHFDSHLDTVDAVWGERWGHASPFIRAIEDGLVDPARMLSIGIKGPLNTADDLSFARARGVTLLTCSDCRREMLAAAAGRPPTTPTSSSPTSPAAPLPSIAAFLARLAGAPAYLTFDIDVVDPAFAPGTGTPSIGGFTSAEICDLLRSLRGLRLAGADLVEVLPDRDPAGITSMLAAQIIHEILALAALPRPA